MSKRNRGAEPMGGSAVALLEEAANQQAAEIAALRTKLGEVEEDLKIKTALAADYKQGWDQAEEATARYIRERDAALATVRQPEHVVRAFERGARAERARVLEQARVSGLQWGSNAEKKRGLEEFVRELRDERLPIPVYKPEGA